jgi:hypothetical protein
VVSGKVTHCPLSCLFSQLNFLQILFNKVASINLLKAPIPQASNDFPVIQYTDDTLLIMQADAN